MNNEQFRRLLFNNTSSQNAPSKTHSPSKPETPSSSLGSKARSSIPMTPRTVTGTGSDFARQLAEHRRETGRQQPPTKKFKSSAAPKGTKLPSGYQDRALQRQALGDEDDEDAAGDRCEEEGRDGDIEKRVQALEEMVKRGQIERDTFEGLMRELGVGGDVGSTHMVKGLDWELLRKIKAGEDVSGNARGEGEVRGESVDDGEREGEGEVDVDEEFEKVLEERGLDVAAAPKEKKERKGSMAPPPPPLATAQKRSRDEILRQLKASRAGSTDATESQPAEPTPALGTKFKKFGDTKAQKKRFVEADENGRRREVLLITDAEGNTKRKIRWLDKPGEANGKPSGPPGLLVPDKDAKPLGMEVPEFAKSAAPPEEKDDDIFEGVGAEYNPLGDIGDDTSSDSGEEGEIDEKPVAETEKAPAEAAAEKPAIEPLKHRNYFSTSTVEPTEAEPGDRSNPLLKDPTLMAAFKRAATLRQGSPAELEDKGDSSQEAVHHRKNFLEEIRRRDAQDAMDMDMGFGGSRIEDEEDEEGPVFEERGGSKRKRGPKKRKGDKESASDVMRVVEGRKK